MRLELGALYVGPDQVMPVASLLAAIAGVVLIFWNKLLSVLRRISGVFRHSPRKAGVTQAAEEHSPR